jgi:hypothetical protein
VPRPQHPTRLESHGLGPGPTRTVRIRVAGLGLPVSHDTQASTFKKIAFVHRDNLPDGDAEPSPGPETLVEARKNHECKSEPAERARPGADRRPTDSESRSSAWALFVMFSFQLVACHGDRDRHGHFRLAP